MKQARTSKAAKAARRSDRSPAGRAKAEDLEFGLGSDEERRERREKILEEHRETIKRLGE